MNLSKKFIPGYEILQCLKLLCYILWATLENLVMGKKF
jgi:hypothetical protein